MKSRIALLGGSFDPIHFGHLISARAVAEAMNAMPVVLIPSARPPHKKDAQLTDPAHRLEMARLAVAGDPLFEVDDLELHRSGPSYTFDTVTAFRNKFGPEVEICWLIGADTLPELPTWYRIAELVHAARIVTMTRPGWTQPNLTVLAQATGPDAARQLLADCVETPAIAISATALRARARDGKSIRYLVPEAVASYINAHGLYRTV